MEPVRVVVVVYSNRSHGGSELDAIRGAIMGRDLQFTTHMGCHACFDWMPSEQDGKASASCEVEDMAVRRATVGGLAGRIAGRDKEMHQLNYVLYQACRALPLPCIYKLIKRVH